MKVLISDPLPGECVNALETSGRFEVDLIPELDEDSLVRTIPPYHAIVVRSRTRMTRRIIDAARELKIIVRGGVGLDNIDLDAARARNITVANTPGTSSESVAELTIAFILCLARQIPRAHAGLVAGRWEKKLFRGSEIGGKTLGVIGMGRIGQSVSRKARALSMMVLGYDPYVSEAAMKAAGAEAATLEAIRRSSDYLSIHVPLAPETKNLVDEAFLAGTKRGVRIINCSRGGVVDENALGEAIDSGAVAGVALDVFADEPPGRNPLLAKDCVIATPHIGAATYEAQERVGKEVVKVLMDFEAGK